MLYKNMEMLAASNKPHWAKGRFARLDYVANVAHLNDKKVAPPPIRRRRLKALRFETEHIN